MNAPVVSVQDFKTTLLNTAFQVAEIFSVTDADGDPITQYRFTDLSNSPVTGQLRLNGALQGNGATVTINANQLGGLQYFGGSDISMEGLRIEAFDGQFWSAARVIDIYSTYHTTISS